MSGLEAEEYVARSLRGRGASCTVDTKQPGATDVDAIWPTGTRWLIQVKSTISRTRPAWPSRQELGRLKARGTRLKATAVVALVHRNKTIEFFSARNGRVLHPTDTRDL